MEILQMHLLITVFQHVFIYSPLQVRNREEYENRNLWRGKEKNIIQLFYAKFNFAFT